MYHRKANKEFDELLIPICCVLIEKDLFSILTNNLILKFFTNNLYYPLVSSLFLVKNQL